MFRIIFIIVLLCFKCWGQEGWDQGVALFQQKKYEKALAVFKTDEASQQAPIGALVGQLFCSVALGHEIEPIVTLIDQKLESLPPCEPSSQPPLKSENHQMAYLCRRKVREVANEMRQTVELLVRETVPGVFQKIKVLRQLYPFIDTLERAGLECCQHNSSWECCLDPLLRQLEVWNNFGLSLENINPTIKQITNGTSEAKDLLRN